MPFLVRISEYLHRQPQPPSHLLLSRSICKMKPLTLLHDPMALLGACSCPEQYSVTAEYRILNDCAGLFPIALLSCHATCSRACAGTGTKHGSVYYVCTAPANGIVTNYQGAFELDDAVEYGEGCRAPNPRNNTRKSTAAYSSFSSD